MHIHWKQTPADSFVFLGINADHPHAQAVLQASYAQYMLLRAGDTLSGAFGDLQLVSSVRLPGPALLSPVWTGRWHGGPPPPGMYPCERSHQGLSLAWITLSDKGARGERIDASGPAIRDTLAESLSSAWPQASSFLMNQTCSRPRWWIFACTSVLI